MYDIYDQSSGALVLHALASSSPMRSALLLLEPCAFASMIDPARRVLALALLALVSSSPRARALSHDLTMATHFKHAHYITKWRIRHPIINVPHAHTHFYATVAIMPN